MSESEQIEEQDEQHVCHLHAIGALQREDELWYRGEPAGAVSPGAVLVHFYVVRDNKVRLLDADPISCRWHMLAPVAGMNRQDLIGAGYRRVHTVRLMPYLVLLPMQLRSLERLDS